MREPVVEFRDFSFQYFAQAEPTVSGIDLTLYRGEKVLMIGPSGSGKSTLCNCINGLIPFSFQGEMKGSCRVCGRETRELGIFELSRHVGTVLQDPDGQFIALTAGEDIAFALENDLVPQPEMKETVRRAAALVNMQDYLRASPHELSGGQKQRVALAGVMVNDVDILLFDEPLANLDPATGKTAIDLIDRVWRGSGKTVVIVEHRLEDVLYRDVDRVLVIAEGRIVADLPPDELIASRTLPPLGIREPLYATLLRYAGRKITPELRAGRLATLDVAAVREDVRAWYAAQSAPEPPAETPAALTVDNVSFRYTTGGRQILQNVSFTVREGEMMSVVGTNGAGKSTLAKLVCGFMKPDGGRLLLGERDMADMDITRRASRIGYVMQNPNQMICKPMIFDEVALGLRLRGVPEAEAKERAWDAMKVCGVYPFRNWPISALSFGQKKRVTVASILALGPRIIILDEPTAGQDYRHYTDIMEFLRRLNAEGVTIVLITHDMHLMLEYTPHAVVLDAGRVIADESAAAVLTDEDVTRRASLKVTSLYELAGLCGIADGTGFVERFIAEERRRRSTGEEAGA